MKILSVWFLLSLCIVVYFECSVSSFHCLVVIFLLIHPCISQDQRRSNFLVIILFYVAAHSWVLKDYWQKVTGALNPLGMQLLHGFNGYESDHYWAADTADVLL